MFNPSLVRRVALCFCVPYIVDPNSAICKTCGKIVMMIHLNKYRMVNCICANPAPNEMYFCESCKGVVVDESGNRRRETLISVQRVLDFIDLEKEKEQEEEKEKEKARLRRECQEIVAMELERQHRESENRRASIQRVRDFVAKEKEKRQ